MTDIVILRKGPYGEGKGTISGVPEATNKATVCIRNQLVDVALQ